MRRRRGVVIDDCGPVRAARRRMLRTRRERSRPPARARQADQRCEADDQRKRQLECEKPDERSHRDRPQQAVVQRAGANAPGGVDDDGYDCWLDSRERRCHPALLAKRHVDPRQQQQDQQRRQHEQQPGCQPAHGAMHQPAQIGGELLRLGAGQQHAVIERMQKPAFADPAAARDQLGMHDRDLPGRAAEADEAQLQPEAQRLGKAGRRRPALTRGSVGGRHASGAKSSSIRAL